MKDFYVYVSNTDSLGIFPENKANFFESFLGEYISLEGTNWQVGVKEVFFEISSVNRFYDLSNNSEQHSFIILSDLCDVSILNGKKLGILRKIFICENNINHIIFNTPIYIPLKTKRFNSIKIISEESSGRSAEFLNKINLTLHFRKTIW